MVSKRAQVYKLLYVVPWHKQHGAHSADFTPKGVAMVVENEVDPYKDWRRGRG